MFWISEEESTIFSASDDLHIFVQSESVFTTVIAMIMMIRSFAGSKLADRLSISFVEHQSCSCSRVVCISSNISTVTRDSSLRLVLVLVLLVCWVHKTAHTHKYTQLVAAMSAEFAI